VPAPTFPQEPALWGRSYRKVKHVVFMVPDGMGLADVTATRIRKHGITDRAHITETGSDSYRFRRTVERRQKKTV
jgi:alkaline phosphatase